MKIKTGNDMNRSKLSGFIISAILVAICMGTGIACSNPTTDRSILPDSLHIEEGDVVLRRGTGMTSRAVMLADGGSDYSHCGIVVIVDGKAMVVHAVPDEPDFEGDVDRVKMEPIRCFYSSIRASKGCVLRCKNRGVARRSARKATEYYRRGLLFDHNYDIADSTELYCSELVELAYRAGGRDISDGKRHNIRLPGMKLQNVILPSDFLKSKELYTVSRFRN